MGRKGKAYSNKQHSLSACEQPQEWSNPFVWMSQLACWLSAVLKSQLTEQSYCEEGDWDPTALASEGRPVVFVSYRVLCIHKFHQLSDTSTRASITASLTLSDCPLPPSPSSRILSGLGCLQSAGSVWRIRRPGGPTGAVGVLSDSLSSWQHPRPAGCLQRPSESGHFPVLSLR